MNLSVIIACHNRKNLTVRCIEKAQAAADYAGARISFTVFDDGSTDGTADALAQMQVSLRIMHGDGSAYWASSMAHAEGAVLANTDAAEDGLIVWLNDDVALDLEAFARLGATVRGATGSVVIGATRDPVSGEATYSGMRKAGIHPLRFDLVSPHDSTQCIDAFNGNLVMVPLAVAHLLGGIDGGFSHALADIDYGMRCKRAGVNVLLAPLTYGTCERNEMKLPGPIIDDWRSFLGPKGGGNFKSLRRILAKSHSRTWFFIVTATYGLWWIRRVFSCWSGRRAGAE
jgi:GT2 family glycosyltransferase